MRRLRPFGGFVGHLSRRASPPAYFSGRAITEIGGAARQQLFGGGAISGQAIRLVKRSLIPVKAQPAQAVEDAVDQFRAIALDVGVFDAQNERAARVAREKPVEQGRARAAHVQIAGGRGRKTHAHGAGGRIRVRIYAGNCHVMVSIGRAAALHLIR